MARSQEERVVLQLTMRTKSSTFSLLSTLPSDLSPDPLMQVQSACSPAWLWFLLTPKRMSSRHYLRNLSNPNARGFWDKSKLVIPQISHVSHQRKLLILFVFANPMIMKSSKYPHLLRFSSETLHKTVSRVSVSPSPTPSLYSLFPHYFLLWSIVLDGRCASSIKDPGTRATYSYGVPALFCFTL